LKNRAGKAKKLLKKMHIAFLECCKSNAFSALMVKKPAENELKNTSKNNLREGTDGAT